MQSTFSAFDRLEGTSLVDKLSRRKLSWLGAMHYIAGPSVALLLKKLIALIPHAGLPLTLAEHRHRM